MEVLFDGLIPVLCNGKPEKMYFSPINPVTFITNDRNRHCVVKVPKKKNKVSTTVVVIKSALLVLSSCCSSSN